ncbi:flagellar biosynthetic protein FliO [Sphingomonas sp. LaA6.9]|uniref:flagellar biosynthetic protein FliO n=1 Tax=Sphingomonas sp. LaA6.9 TaxID=2919914 RepID=UPI001F4F51C5|nr:flagellar biosynthetic protein FliO [Sphingomonas sp. LaA6.9]MCJ8156357.1 flagellar biosynthetic protein FliO [Sphingomonas sp. LaA6.9]
MMTAYILRLLILLPLVAGLAYGALWLWRRVGPDMAIGKREKLVRLVDVLPMGATGRLAVVEFADRHLLVSVARGRIELLADSKAPESTDA